MRERGTELHKESNKILFYKSSIWETLYKGDTLAFFFFNKEVGKRNPSSFHHCISLPLFAMLTSFQFTQSALPTRLAALFPCDSCWPIAAQAHLVPCEAGALLHYITAATGCHGNTHGHYHTVLECVWNDTLCVFVSVLNVYRDRVPTGLVNH